MASAPLFTYEHTLGGTSMYPTQPPFGNSRDAIDASQLPTQPSKRRRISRACDECRRRKMKCDGGNPCENCANYSSDCTYNKPSNRQKRPGLKEWNDFNVRVQEAENKLRILFPGVDFSKFKENLLIPGYGVDSNSLDDLRTPSSLENDAQVTPDSNSSVTREHQIFEPQIENEVEYCNDNLNLPSNIRIDSVSLPYNTPDEAIFQFINFEGDEGSEVHNDNVVETSFLDPAFVQNSPADCIDLNADILSGGNFLQTWTYENGTPYLEEMIETGVFIEDNSYGII